MFGGNNGDTKINAFLLYGDDFIIAGETSDNTLTSTSTWSPFLAMIYSYGTLNWSYLYNIGSGAGFTAVSKTDTYYAVSTDTSPL
jgi:hypothetical protein